MKKKVETEFLEKYLLVVILIIIFTGGVFTYYSNFVLEINSSRYDTLYKVKKANEVFVSNKDKGYVELQEFIDKCSEDNKITYHEYKLIMDMHINVDSVHDNKEKFFNE